MSHLISAGMHTFPALLLSAALLAPLQTQAEQPNATPTQAKLEVSSEVVERLSESVTYLLSLSEEDALKIVPKDSRGIFWTTCPACRKRSRVALWEWAPEKPQEIECKDCHTRFPHRDYPDPGYLEVAAPGGAIRFHYYEGDASSGKKRYFLRAAADDRARNYMATRARDLAQLYSLTGREECASRALAILGEFARVFPRYPYIYDGEWHGKPVAIFSIMEPPPEGQLLKLFQPCRWSFWGYMEIPRELLATYDALQKWPGLETDKGRKISKAFVQNVLEPQIRCLQRFPEHHRGNMSISARWPSLLQAARLLKRPDLTAYTLEQIAQFEKEALLYDGSWWETSPSYSGQIMRSGITKLYSAMTGEDNLTESGEQEIPIVQRFSGVRRAMEATLMPSGGLIPVNDTWAFNRPLPPRESMQPALWPGFGVAILGGGTGDTQWHSHLNFTSGRSHKHADTLSIGLAINDKELLPDIGYTHSRYRPWTIATHSHNTVVVNGKRSEIDEQHVGNRLQHYVADPEGFQMVSAMSMSAYPKITSRYLRTLVWVGSDAANAFLIDLFEVYGGSQHDYLLHGSADEDSDARFVQLEAQPYDGTLMAPGATFTPPTVDRASVRKKGDDFGYVRNICHAQSPGGTVELKMSLRATPEVGTRTFLATQAGDQLFLGEAPSIRRIIVKHLNEDDSKLDAYVAPFFSWRRTGKQLRSHFAAVHQPLKSGKPIREVVVQKLGDHGILYRIDYGEGERVYFAKSDHPANALEVATEDGRLHLEGEMGFLRLRGGALEEARLIGGKRLALDDHQLQGQGILSGNLLQIDETSDGPQRFRIEGILSQNAHYPLLILTFPDHTERAFSIQNVQADGDRHTLITVTEHAGFRISEKEISITSYPARKIAPGPIRYRISPLTSWLIGEPQKAAVSALDL